MISAPPPHNEPERIAALRALQILDTPPEARFDFLTQLATQLLGVPISLVSLVDTDRQWFKSCVGVRVRETPRREALCSYVVHSNEPLVIADAQQDERFVDNPLVTGEPHIRFYAGIPLRALGGECVGSFCAIDSHPRSLSDKDFQTLQTIAELVEHELNSQILIHSYRVLEESKRKAEQSARIKADFLANMSHEIRTPLNGILGLSDLLMESSLTPEQRHQLQSLRESADSLLALVNDILDFSRIEAGKVQLETVAFSVRSLIHSLQDLYGPLADKKGIRLTTTVDPVMPDLVKGDMHRLRQVVTNLLGNAIKFTEEGEVALEVKWVEAHSDRVHFRIAVRDTGIGISSEHQSKIFDAFTQADTSITRRFSGSGLGLSISAQLTLLMGGNLTVESQPGRGSTFVVDLWLTAAGHEVTSEASSQTHAIDSSGASLTGPMVRILLAEDNEINQQVALGLLKKRNYNVSVAKNGREALELLQKQSFDLVLMDQMMPEIDGLEATSRLRELEKGTSKHLPVIAMTANAMAGDRERCLAAGMDDYLSKPIRKEELFRIIDNVLQKISENQSKAA